MRTIIAVAILTSSVVLAQPEDKVVAGEVVHVARTAIIPSWDPTARAVRSNVDKKCYPTAAEALAQLDYFYKILEIAREKVPADDPIAKDQPARKKQLEGLVKIVREMPKSNLGCPEIPLKPSTNSPRKSP